MAKPKTPEHLQRCEDAAAKLLQGKKKISHADVLRIVPLDQGADWPTQVRPNVAPTANPEVTGLVLGLSPNRQGGCSIAQAWKSKTQRPHWLISTQVAAVPRPDPSRHQMDPGHATGRRLPLRLDPSELQLPRAQATIWGRPISLRLRGHQRLDGHRPILRKVAILGNRSTRWRGGFLTTQLTG